MSRLTVVKLTRLLPLACFVASSCSADDEPDGLPGPGVPGVIIGAAFNECGGDCVELLLVRGGVVYEDVESGYLTGPASSWRFEREGREPTSAALADSLLSEFPVGVLAELPPEGLGCPDCGDWGALPVAYVDAEGRIVAEYTLDNLVANMDETVQPYGRLVRRALREL